MYLQKWRFYLTWYQLCMFSSRVYAEGMSLDICILHLHWCLLFSLYKKNACVTLNRCHSDDSSQTFHYLYLMRSLSDVFFFPVFSLTDRFSLCYWDHLVSSLPSLSPSVLRSNRDGAGCFTSLGSSLQGKLSTGGAIELCGGMWQGSVCCAGQVAGEGPGGTNLCTPEEPARSAGHLHIRAPATGALPWQAERFKCYCS